MSHIYSATVTINAIEEQLCSDTGFFNLFSQFVLLVAQHSIGSTKYSDAVQHGAGSVPVKLFRLNNNLHINILSHFDSAM